MLGLQETRSAGTPSTKTYNCVACSATFNGLASLLVHQASHANEIPDHKVSTLPTCSHCGGLFASQELLEKHHCMVLPPPVAQDVCRCDCGEEFDELCDLQEHKTKHEEETPPLGEPSNTNSEAEPEVKTAGSHDTLVEVLPSPCEDSPSHCVDEDTLDQDTLSVSEADKKECIPTSDLPPVQDDVAQEHRDEGLQPSVPSAPSTPTEEPDPVLENEAENVKSEKSALSDGEESANESEKSESNDKKSLLKMLASAYLSRRQPAQMKWEQSKRTLPPRKVSPRAPMQTPAVISTSSSGDFVNQLRQKVAKYGPAGEGCRQPDGSMVNVKPKKKKKIKRIVSTTKTLYPVVALETCQKLVKDNIEGKHQCGVCRRVFQDVDSLIMHHALHKKERVKYCRRCRQYLICVISVPNNHICSVANVGTPRHFTFVRKGFLTSNNPMMLHSRKLFHCTLCNRSYTRRHNLNKHNCQWIASLKCSATSAEKDAKVHNFGEGCSAGKQLGSLEHNSSRQINIGVNTGDLQFVKAEELSADFPFKEMRLVTQPSPVKSGIHLGSAKSFPPFLAKVPKFNSVQLTELTAARMREGSDAEERESLEESQWTVPLDDTEIDVMMDVDEEKHHLVEAPKDNSDDVVILEPAIKCQPSLVMSSKDFQVHISESGVKRFSCNRCQRSYSRRFTVKQHLKICGARKLMEQRSFGKASILALKKKFPCPHCGTSFTRKDNMNIHRKRCQSMRNASILAGNRMLEKKNQASQENMFVLPPVSKSLARQESGKNNSGSGNWGIMSLPSVLPRRVTCECGAAFTCPRLLFEHLQLHAMESYICSHCGENLQSWAEFEAHQKLHAQTPRQKSEQLQHFQASVQNLSNRPQDLSKSRLANRPLTEPCVCHRCKKIFGGRKSLLRHLRLSCRGDVAVQRKHSCTRCGMTFQSPLAHKVHVQSNTCTPSFKPIRCPVCVRWFSCVDGLKRHLVSHSQQKVLTCPTCRHKCSSHEDLEEHKRKVHGTKEASASPTIQSAQVSQSNPSNAFRCQICQRSYPKLQSLKDHLRKVHRPQGLNQVSLSGAFQAKAGGLQSAVGAVQQSQSKQYQCQICARTYPDIQSLKNHRRRVHRILGSGLQPSKATGQQSHSSQFQCHICSRSYPDLRSLRNHRRRVHRILGGLEMFKGKVVQSPDSPFKCQMCQRSYPDVRSLKNHRRRVHRILGDIPESAKAAAADAEQSKAEPEVLDVSSPSETATE